ncbi:MAG: protein translocase subunit SecD, partial [Miltoncostaeaceae bacterium]
MRRSLLLLAVVLGLVCASLVAISQKPATLGLDLQGGVEVVLQGQPTPEVPEVDEDAINRSIEVIRNRVDAFGVAEPEIQSAGSDQIIVALPGAENPEQVVTDLIKPAQLFFFDYEGNLVGPEGDPSLRSTIERANQSETDSTRSDETFWLLDRNGDYLAGPLLSPDDLEDIFPKGRPGGSSLERVPPGWFIASEERGLSSRPDGPSQTVWHLLQDNPGLFGRDITESRSQQDVGAGGIGDNIVVTMEFTGRGEDAFQEITRELSRRGALVQTNQRFAIVLDGEIISNPTVDFRDFPTGIDGRNGAQIQGNFSRGEANRLADQLNSGAIPINLEVISLKQVSATLGEQSLQQGLVAGIAGLILVVLFLIAYYRVLGVITALALLFYAAMFYAVIVLVPITLTLPGIAGIILTIGIASDANVVIFERVREEARAGKTPRAALLGGYRKGLSAIIDANFVTLITAAILFLFATGGVKGFAFTLGAGVILSLFTVLTATRAMFGVLSETRFLRDDRFMGFNQWEPKWKMDFVGKWRLWLALSFIPVLAGLGFIAINGLNLGLDFESGTRIVTVFEQPADEDGVREVLAGQGIDNAKIQATTENVDGADVDGFQIQTETLTPEQLQDVRRGLNAEFTVNDDSYQVDLVGPTFGEQVIRSAITALIVSFVFMVIYLTIRFEYKLALPALLSVVQDVLLSVGIYAFTGREFTSATVAALLTVLGYSLYDVVIVFDRIRDNVPLMRNAPYRDIVNRSIHEVLNRSIITTATTTLPILALFFFGGDTLKDFAFALLVGIFTGGVSSIVIAAPLAALWKEREPQQKRVAARARKKTIAISGDSDVVDLDVLERAEAALDSEYAEAPEPTPLLEEPDPDDQDDFELDPEEEELESELDPEGVAESELEVEDDPEPEVEAAPEPEIEVEPEVERDAEIEVEPEVGSTTGDADDG